MRILIIEDDKDLAQLTKLALEKENFTVDICLDGAEGLTICRKICMIWYFWTACFLPWMEPRF